MQAVGVFGGVDRGGQRPVPDPVCCFTTGHGKGGEGAAVEAPVEDNDVLLPSLVAGKLDGALDCLGASDCGG